MTSITTCNFAVKLVFSVIIIILLVLIFIKFASYAGYNILPNLVAEAFQNINNLASMDQILYINLEKRDDRKKEILAELDKMGAPAEKIQRVAGVYIPKNGHKGCVQSHILCLKLAQMNNWSRVAIFEDDAQIVPEISPDVFKEKLAGALSELPADWDVLMLSTANKKDEKLDDKKYINRLKFATTSSAYIIRDTYYSKLIALFEFINMMMSREKWSAKDNGHEHYALDQKWTELQDRDNWYCLKTDIISQRPSHSTINSRE